ncbi:MAG TPA: hypothetical protein VJX67_12135 [Blastocatellia bacterium]|nr:hypothetical protein [Blastocatellia bacterium]
MSVSNEQFLIEYNITGRFRIRTADLAKSGEWTAYASVATFVFQGRQYAAFSPYWEGKVPVNRVLELNPQETLMREINKL